MQGPQPLILGHRGASADAPENTLPAFARAMADGADGVELDVQLSRDGRLVVIHDFVLGRTANGGSLVADTSFEDLRRLDAGAWFGAPFAATRIPTLDEVYDLLHGRARLINIEIKKVSPEIPVEDALADFLSSRPDVRAVTLVSSFDHPTLRRFKDRRPDVRTGALYVASLVEPARYAQGIPVDALHPRYDAVTADVVNDARAAGLAVNVWTVNEIDDARRLAAIGVNVIMTDRPAAIRRALATPRR
jgi:glycerophosphoryl diester phosphodiesterase